ncbi:TetR/AcrR family transcriptional regulator [Clostridium sp. BL-8]|uniref:TetR/AcrR family transcriptional regulator n=1 Tax=Clostridium sp. BL-8 TaxID=349938 RepID=UPI00098C8614|nr:TetR/AcrR family transcriptional regulator [Clostridium sp. BL-8]OOM80099.1 transposon Tn10 TetC protein [Clostridium sp. BL-8]
MNRRERKKEITKEIIIDSALALFKEKGFQETYMEEIAVKSDVSKGTLYNYFQDKESIVSAYFKSLINNYSNNFNEVSEEFKKNGNIEETLNSILDFINHIYQNNMEFTAIYFRYRMQTLFYTNPIENPHRSGLEGLISEIVKNAQENNQLRKDISSTILARNFQFLHMNYFISSVYGNKDINLEASKAQIIELFINGAGAQKN